MPNINPTYARPLLNNRMSDENQMGDLVIATQEIGIINVPNQLTPDAMQLAVRQTLLSEAAAIERVSGQKSQDMAVLVIRRIKAFATKVETARKAAKGPYLKAGEAIDALAKKLMEGLADEESRLTKDIKAYQLKVQKEEERRQAEAAAAARRLEQEQRRLEAEQQAAVQMALDTGKQTDLDKAQELGLQAAQVGSKIAEQTIVRTEAKSEGMTAKKTWKAVVKDVKALYAARPDLVELTPKNRDLQALARSSDGTLVIPGVEFIEDIGTRFT